jgi:hypothetical protein
MRRHKHWLTRWITRRCQRALMGRLPDDLALEIELLSPSENRIDPSSVPTCRSPSAPYAGWPLDLLRARRAKNASGTAANR